MTEIVDPTDHLSVAELTVCVKHVEGLPDTLSDSYRTGYSWGLMNRMAGLDNNVEQVMAEVLDLTDDAQENEFTDGWWEGHEWAAERADSLPKLRRLLAENVTGRWHSFGSDAGQEVPECTCAGGGPYGHEQYCGIEGPVFQAAPEIVDTVVEAVNSLPAILEELDGLRVKLDAVTELIKPQWRRNTGYEHDSLTEAYAGGRNDMVDAIREAIGLDPNDFPDEKGEADADVETIDELESTRRSLSRFRSAARKVVEHHARTTLPDGREVCLVCPHEAPSKPAQWPCETVRHLLSGLKENRS